MTISDSLTDEQLAKLKAWIDKQNQMKQGSIKVCRRVNDDIVCE